MASLPKPKPDDNDEYCKPVYCDHHMELALKDKDFGLMEERRFNAKNGKIKPEYKDKSAQKCHKKLLNSNNNDKVQPNNAPQHQKITKFCLSPKRKSSDHKKTLSKNVDSNTPPRKMKVLDIVPAADNDAQHIECSELSFEVDMKKWEQLPSIINDMMIPDYKPIKITAKLYKDSGSACIYSFISDIKWDEFCKMPTRLMNQINRLYKPPFWITLRLENMRQ